MMTVYLIVGADGFVEGYGSSPFSDDSISVEVAEDSDFLLSPMSYKYADGALVKDGGKHTEIVEQYDNYVNKPSVEEEIAKVKSVSSAIIGEGQVNDIVAAQQLNRALCLFANTLPEEEALTIAAVFPEWDKMRKYKKDEYLRYGLNQDGEPQIYRVISSHTAQADWTPEVAVSLFKKVGFTGDGTAVWIQPMGAHDAYDKGDRVSYNGAIYVSTTNGNVWAPDVYGWTKETTATAQTTTK